MAKVYSFFVASLLSFLLFSTLLSSGLFAVDADSLLNPDATDANTPKATIKISLKGPMPAVSQQLYGLSLDEVSYTYDGGLYPELLTDRAVFEKERVGRVKGWLAGKTGSPVTPLGDDANPLSDVLAASLRVVTKEASADQPGNLVNSGYFGVPLKPNTKYHLSLYAKYLKPDANSTLLVRLQNVDGTTTFLKANTPPLTEQWQKIDLDLNTDQGLFPTPEGLFSIGNPNVGEFWMNLVSLTESTSSNYTSGFRPELMDKLKDLKPAFIRIPGTTAIQGGDATFEVSLKQKGVSIQRGTLSSRFDWKALRGPMVYRRPHLSDKGYYCSGGVGILELMECCEDLNAQPVLVVYSGFTVKTLRVPSGPLLDRYVQDALDEVEYLTGDQNSTYWGGLRAKDGHPNPFKLTYVEVGGDDSQNIGNPYEDRFGQFYDAFQAKYPNIKLIPSAPVTKGPPEIIAAKSFAPSPNLATSFKPFQTAVRGGPKFLLQGWGFKEFPGAPALTPMDQTLNNATWMLMMEKNSDVIQMASYGSILSHVQEAGKMGFPDLITFDGLHVVPSPTYYVQKMFATHLGTVIPTSTLETAAAYLKYGVTMDKDAGVLYVKMINNHAGPQPVDIVVTGAGSVDSSGQVVTLHFDHPEDTNTVDNPQKIVPVSEDLSDINYSYHYTLAPNSITVLTMNAKLPDS